MVTWFPPSTSPKSACRRLPNFDPQRNCEWKDTDLSLEMLWADSFRFQSRDAIVSFCSHIFQPCRSKNQCQPCQVIPTLIIAGNEVESLQVPFFDTPFRFTQRFDFGEQISWIRWRCFFFFCNGKSTTWGIFGNCFSFLGLPLANLFHQFLA